VPVDRPDTFINTPPAPPSGSTVKSKDATFTYTSDKSPVTFECSLDGSPFSDCTSQPKKYTNLADGQHTFQVRAKDADGHEDRTPATRTWKIDATPPETTITSGPPAVLTNSFTAKFGFTSNEAESTFQCSLDNGPYGSCTSPKTYTGLSVGNHTFRVKATDKAGNVDPTPAVRSFQVRWVVFIGGKSYTCTKVGTQGNDVLTGTVGNDVICGLGGNDTLRGLGGNDVLIGGDGVDTASYQGTTTGVNASLTTNTATGQGSDRFLQIENLTGSDGNDVLTGSAGPNVLIGLKGADRMFGLGGNDTINSKDGVIRNDTLDGGTGTDTKITDATEAKIVGFP
jgi:Ca2+-binding RTX toxin-like protein